MNYKIKMEQKDFLKTSGKLKAKNVIVNANKVTFYTDKQSLDYLDNSKIEYELLTTVKRETLKHINLVKPFILGLVVLCTMLYMNTYRVAKINFNKETPINLQIEDDLKSQFRHLYFSNYCSIDYYEYSKNLRVAYPAYPFINCSKNGSTINVSIYEYDESYQTLKDDPIGNIIATKDGVITEYHIYNGVTDIKKNDYVKKGQILAYSNMLTFTNRTDTLYTSAKGLFLANTYEESLVTVPKIVSSESLSGKTNSYYELEIGSTSIPFGKNSFNTFSSVSNTKFSLFGFINYNKLTYKEINTTTLTYDYDEAYDYAVSKINKDFYDNISVEQECISKMALLNDTETDDSYTFLFLVKKLESIGKFVEL